MVEAAQQLFVSYAAGRAQQKQKGTSAEGKSNCLRARTRASVRSEFRTHLSVKDRIQHFAERRRLPPRR